MSPSGFYSGGISLKMGRPVVFLPRCDSTNIEAKILAEASTGPAGILVVTDEQNAGRGRLGRVWESKAGENLLFSLVLVPDVAPPQAPVCVLAWAAAMAEVLGCLVKWPNDLVTEEGQKLGGILAELSTDSSGLRFVVLGVGINVNQTDFSGLPDATSLALLSGEYQDRADLLARLVTAVEAVSTTVKPSLETWRARSHTLGCAVVVGDVRGLATDIREDGALLVDGVAVLTGDVQLVASVDAPSDWG